ncbi:FadR/GntR family transcriptional regulator [Dactylosporangium sp. CA-139066]|uniref:FadR/GntR family transcriptional regulator n=1 Tax=Dactylosporangium sp. CA-139066 TaxID=3239930 RepID=UPI003D8E738B
MPPKRATVVAQRIVRQIQKQKLAPGTMLPAEHEMIEQYGVGRSTVREALRVLELQGVVTIRPGRGGGPIVSTPDSRHLASTLALLMQFAETPFRAAVEARAWMEPITAALCAERADAQLRAELQESINRMRAGLADSDVFLDENHRFHELIAQGAANPVFSYFLNSLHWITDGTPLGVEYPPRSRKAVLAAHERVWKAVEAGDASAAHEAMREHMEETLTYFERKYGSVMDEVLTWEMYGT